MRIDKLKDSTKSVRTGEKIPGPIASGTFTGRIPAGGAPTPSAKPKPGGGLAALAKPAPVAASTGGPLIKAMQKSLFEHDAKRDTSYLHASELETYCPRRNMIYRIFTLEAEPFLPSFQLHVTFDIGTAIHTHMQNEVLARNGTILGKWWCPTCGTIVGEEAPVPRPAALGCPAPTSGHMHYWRYVEGSAVDVVHKIGGSIDGFITADEGLEIKTISQGGFNKLNGILPAHITQAQVYMHLFNLKKQHFLYVSKGWHEPSEHQVRVHPSRLKPPVGWKCGPVAEFTLERDQRRIDTLLDSRTVELEAAKATESGGVEHYPPCGKQCSHHLAAAVKRCPVGAICMDLVKEGM